MALAPESGYGLVVGLISGRIMTTTIPDKDVFVDASVDVSNGIFNAEIGGVTGTRDRSAVTGLGIEGCKIGIFGGYRSTNARATFGQCGAGCRVKRATLDLNNTDEHLDLIPVRVGNVGYLYDNISGKLFGNAADSGALIVGPDKN